MQDGPANAFEGVADAGPAPRPSAPEVVVGADFRAWLAVPAAAAVASGVALAAGALLNADLRAIGLGALVAFVPTLLTPIAMSMVGRRPLSVFGACAMVASVVRNLATAAIAWALLAAVEVERNPMLIALLAVAIVALVAEKAVALRALRPAWALTPGDPAEVPC